MDGYKSVIAVLPLEKRHLQHCKDNPFTRLRSSYSEKALEKKRSKRYIMFLTGTGTSYDTDCFYLYFFLHYSPQFMAFSL